jgi:hypothetical protein
MGIKFPTFLNVLALAVASTTIAIAAQAQDAPVVFRPRETPPEAMNEAFFESDPSMLRQSDFTRAIQSWFGLFPFPENAIRQDAQDTDELYNYLMERQVGDDPVIRTADLVNPFNTSVLTLPTTEAAQIGGSEFVFERPPEMSTPMPLPPSVPAPSVPPSPVEAKF